jgi:hypothetical protein
MRLKPGDCFIAQDVVILSYSELLLAGIVDITERHMAQQSHAHSQQRLEQLLRAKTLLAQLLQSGPSPHVSAKATEILQLVDKKLQQRDTGISWSASGFLNVQAQIRPNGTDSTPYRLLQDDRSAALAHLVEAKKRLKQDLNNIALLHEDGVFDKAAADAQVALTHLS